MRWLEGWGCCVSSWCEHSIIPIGEPPSISKWVKETLLAGSSSSARCLKCPPNGTWSIHHSKGIFFFFVFFVFSLEWTARRVRPLDNSPPRPAQSTRGTHEIKKRKPREKERERNHFCYFNRKRERERETDTTPGAFFFVWLFKRSGTGPFVALTCYFLSPSKTLKNRNEFSRPPQSLIEKFTPSLRCRGE